VTVGLHDIGKTDFAVYLFFLHFYVSTDYLDSFIWKELIILE